ncbi:MAG TPA: TetR/AcrR family transcriptional regulator [Tepidisphaeraceae bacterium]|nr:TetR/AcrR family transcriptional regulator [Tepidisphaeraceae bacterium]
MARTEESKQDLKRAAILRVASGQFSRKPFHEVKLDDIATAAKVGKGTLYLYFQSKDELYTEMVRDGFNELIEQLRQIEPTTKAWPTLKLAVEQVTKWAYENSHFFDMRTVGPATNQSAMRKVRRELGQLIQKIIERGNETGEFHDDMPALTAQFVPAMARSAVVHGPKDLDANATAAHILKVISAAVRKGSR